jgi:hypothetical protein
MTSIANITLWLSFINLQSVGLYFRLMRWMTIILFIACWPRLVEWAGRKYSLTEAHIVLWKSQRVRIAVWLFIFDLLICENIVVLFMRIL